MKDKSEKNMPAASIYKLVINSNFEKCSFDILVFVLHQRELYEILSCSDMVKESEWSPVKRVIKYLLLTM